MNIFERASRNKIRFETVRGHIDTESLWELPLTSTSGFDLNTVAKTANKKLKETSEEDFVGDSATNPLVTVFQLQLDIVKYVIADKKQRAEAAKQAAATKARKQRLLEVLDQKTDEELMGKSKEEIMKEIEELG